MSPVIEVVVDVAIGESIEVAGPGVETLAVAGAEVVWYMPVTIRRVGQFGRMYLLPQGESVGALLRRVVLWRA